MAGRLTLEDARMEMTATQFRHRLFESLTQAAEGTEVSVTHKGRRFRIVPEKKFDRLSRITPMQFINPDVPESVETEMREEMRRKWTADWDEL